MGKYKKLKAQTKKLEKEEKKRLEFFKYFADKHADDKYIDRFPMCNFNMEDSRLPI